jgi:hypothetical protein
MDPIGSVSPKAGSFTISTALTDVLPNGFELVFEKKDQPNIDGVIVDGRHYPGAKTIHVKYAQGSPALTKGIPDGYTSKSAKTVWATGIIGDSCLFHGHQSAFCWDEFAQNCGLKNSWIWGGMHTIHKNLNVNIEAGGNPIWVGNRLDDKSVAD